jgi:glycine cleavage system H lipoate-binding protein
VNPAETGILRNRVLTCQNDDVVMPRLSDSMEEGTILAWLKKVGDEVSVGDELVEIETDKANMSYEAEVAGTLTGSSPRRARRGRSALR